ncbi:MAG: M14 family zinc carboxypeptidase [Candidatus Borkfalkia sp.]
MDALNEVYDFYRAFAGEKFSVGTSVLGRDIPCMKCGEGRPFVIVQYAIHAREWITSLLALSHISIFRRAAPLFLPVTIRRRGAGFWRLFRKERLRGFLRG